MIWHVSQQTGCCSVQSPPNWQVRFSGPRNSSPSSHWNVATVPRAMTSDVYDTLPPWSCGSAWHSAVNHSNFQHANMHNALASKVLTGILFVTNFKTKTNYSYYTCVADARIRQRHVVWRIIALRPHPSSCLAHKKLTLPLSLARRPHVRRVRQTMSRVKHTFVSFAVSQGVSVVSAWNLNVAAWVLSTV